MIYIKNLQKSIGKKKILNDINLTIDKGIYGLLGPNGAGKTTFIRCLSQYYKTNEGQILFSNNNSNIKYGYLPQAFGAFKELTVFEMLLLLMKLKEISVENPNNEVGRCIELVNLCDQKNVQIKKLSGGMLRRLGIAQALLGDPELLLFDEPTAGLDPEERVRFKNIISNLSDEKTTIISTHIVADVESICSNIIIMNNGTIIKTGSCMEIQECALGKTYEIQMDQRKILQEPYEIMQQFEKDSEKFLRIVSSAKQFAVPVEPSIEDGYICLIKNL